MSRTTENQTQIILDSIADGVFTVDQDWKITSFNRAAEKVTGIKKDVAIGRHCWEVFRASICEKTCSLRQTMETGEPIVNQSIFILNSLGERIPVSISTALLRAEGGKVIGPTRWREWDRKRTFRQGNPLPEPQKRQADDNHQLWRTPR